MPTTLAYELLALSVLLTTASIFAHRRLFAASPEQRDLLVRSNPVPVTRTTNLVVIAVLLVVPHFFQVIAFALIVALAAAASIAQSRTLLRMGAGSAFVYRWSGVSALFILGGATFVAALYLGALKFGGYHG